MERRLGEVTRESERLITAIAKGHGDSAELGPRVTALGAERRAIEAELAQEPTKVIALHPGALSHYETKLARLQEAISKGIGRGNIEYAARPRMIRWHRGHHHRQAQCFAW
jgi:hypothetical protein